MFKRITCPTCDYKFNVPEGDMLKLHSCPNCQTPFRAGKSTAEPSISMGQQSPVDPALNKTMLVETAPPICFTCPRCQKRVELPASEAGTKRPCPYCSQRLQVPEASQPSASPPGLDKTMLVSDDLVTGHKSGRHAQIAPAPDPALNKTMLATAEPPIRFNCPRCQKPMEVPASEAGTKRPCPSCSQRVQVPAAGIPAGATAAAQMPSVAAGSSPAPTGSAQANPTITLPFNLSKRTGMIILGAAAGILFLFVLLQLVAPSHDRDAFLQAQKELEELQKQLEANKLEQQRIKAELRRDEEARKQNEQRQREIDELRNDYVILASRVSKEKSKLLAEYDRLDDFADAEARAEAKRKLDAQKRRLADQEEEIRLKQEAVAKRKREEEAEARRQEEEHQARLEREKQLQLQMQQQQHALTLATINASRPAYYPWHWRFFLP